MVLRGCGFARTQGMLVCDINARSQLGLEHWRERESEGVRQMKRKGRRSFVYQPPLSRIVGVLSPCLRRVVKLCRGAAGELPLPMLFGMSSDIDDRLLDVLFVHARDLASRTFVMHVRADRGSEILARADDNRIADIGRCTR